MDLPVPVSVVVVRRALLVLAALLAVSPAAAPASDDALWTLLERGGQVVMIRHAVTTPGVFGRPEARAGQVKQMEPQSGGRFAVAGRLSVR
jgi:hypothetical protein